MEFWLANRNIHVRDMAPFSEWGLVSEQVITGLCQLELQLGDVWFIGFLLTRNTVIHGINRSIDVAKQGVL
jgi:hypothetical protein